jgi:hypothetical protein
MNNAFLNDFIKMRRTLGTASAVPIQSAMETPVLKKGAKKPKGAPPVSKPKGENITLHYIINEKPPESEVKDYFLKRIEELEEEENA